MHLEQVCVSHIGGRLGHEDNFLLNGGYITPDEQREMAGKRFICRTEKTSANIRFFAVCDGMGGHNAGEVASNICVTRLAKLETAVQNSGSFKNIVEICHKAVSDINSEVCAKGRENSALRGMGSTLVLFVMRGSECAVLNVGDSRAYFFDGANISQITKDHTEGQRMLDLNILAPDELINFPARKNLNRYIGFYEPGFPLKADEFFIKTQNGLILLCSDGVSDSLTNVEIEEYLRAESNIKIAAQNIIERAVAKHDSDNATLIIVPIKE